MTTITALHIDDIRFPTSAKLDGSDAMNPDPDYSAAYVTLETDNPALRGYGLTFTIGRGNELCCAAISSLRHLIVGSTLEDITTDMGTFWRKITGDSQLRWVGPDKGVMHLATGAVVNAVWDLWARSEQKPLWRLAAEMTPQELVKCIDFRYISDAITPEEAIELLQEKASGKNERISNLEKNGYPCYTTSAGWLGYDDDKLRRLCHQAISEGFNFVKLKVGGNLQDDIRRVSIAREVIGEKCKLMLDANQVWDVEDAIRWVKKLSFSNPWFIEEPTSPDDIEGHRKIREAVYPVKVATGEMCQNRIIFKQLIMRKALDVVQIDACRLGGVNEALAVMLMAAKYNLPVCPHAGGVGLCEHVQHLSMIDYIAISGTHNGRVIEYVDHLHEHFKNPCIMRGPAYMPPHAPGYSTEMLPSSIEQYRFQESIQY